MLKISFACCLGLCPVISTQFTVEMYVGASNREKNVTKNPYFGVHGRSRSSILVPPKSSSAVLVMMRTATVLLLDWTTVAESARFDGGTHIWCTRTEDPFNLGGRSLHRWNLRLMPKNSRAGCPGLSWMVSAQFTGWPLSRHWNSPTFPWQRAALMPMLSAIQSLIACL